MIDWGVLTLSFFARKLWTSFVNRYICEWSEDCADLIPLSCVGVGLVVSRNIGKWWRFSCMVASSSAINLIGIPELVLEMRWTSILLPLFSFDLCIVDTFLVITWLFSFLLHVFSGSADRGDKDKLSLEVSHPPFVVAICISLQYWSSWWIYNNMMTLNVQNLTLVEIEPLYREPDSNVWRADPMEGAAFASLPLLRILRTVCVSTLFSNLILMFCSTFSLQNICG